MQVLQEYVQQGIKTVYELAFSEYFFLQVRIYSTVFYGEAPICKLSTIYKHFCLWALKPSIST